MTTNRELPNTFIDYDPKNSKSKIFDINTKQLNKNEHSELLDALFKLLERLEEYIHTLRLENYTIASGTMGLSLLYFHLYKILNRPIHLDKAFQIFKDSWAYHTINYNWKGRSAFLKGESGILAMGALLYNELGKKTESNDFIKILEQLHLKTLKCVKTKDLSDGLAGYLYSLLLVKNYLGENAISKPLIKMVVNTILKSGKKLSKLLSSSCPLLFSENKENYSLGVSKGNSGILLILLYAKEYISFCDLHDFIKPTIDFVRKQQFPSGNFPVALGKSEDELVQWCNGAPGVIHLMAEAFEQFGDIEYLQACDNCSRVIWERGILKKGLGLCHGVAGNAYAYLRMFRLTGKEKYIYRAYKFATWCSNFDHIPNWKIERLVSLFDGLPGTVYFLADMLDPTNAAFPGFELLKKR